MKKNFPKNIFFNRKKFRDDFHSAKDESSYKVRTISGMAIDKSEYFQKEPELRYIIEAHSNDASLQIEGFVREYLVPEATVEMLFGDIGDQSASDDLRNFYLLKVPGITIENLTQSTYDIAYALQVHGDFKSVEPDVVYTQFLGSHSLLTSSQSGEPPDKAWSLRNMRVEKAWSMKPVNGKKDGKGITICHLDTGWTLHDDLDQVNFDKSRAKDFISGKGDARDPLNYYLKSLKNPGHGTKTGSVIMSRGGVTYGLPLDTTKPGVITGVAREVTYVPVRCIRSVVIIYNSDLARAVRYSTAVAGDIISMSLGGRGIKALHLAIKDAVRSNVIVICAAGNNVRLVVWPARYPETLAVAANNISDKPWSGSSRGRAVDITAPGEDVWKADPDPKCKAYSSGCGTSYATANVAGVAALWLAFHGKGALINIAARTGISVQELFRESIKDTARVPQGWDKKSYGAGIVNAQKLLQHPPLSGGENSTYQEKHGGLASMIDERNLQVSEAILAELFKDSEMSPDDMIDFFGNELSNLLLDNINVLNMLQETATHNNYGLLTQVKILLKKQASETLWKTAHWA